MKSFRNLSQQAFLKQFFVFLTGFFLVGAVCMPDRAQMIPGFVRIITGPANVYTNYFALGGYAATLLNMGLVCAICTALYWIPGKKEGHASMLVVVLTTGFGAWGINVLNIWPTMAGVVLYCLVKKQKLGDHTNAMLFTTGVAPLMSELMLRYPNPEVVGFSPAGIGMALLVGIAVGFFLPAGLDNSPKVHKGFDLYSAALPVGMMAFVLQGFLYKALGVDLPVQDTDLSVADPWLVNIFCIVLFSLCIVGALLMGCTWKDYRHLQQNPDPVRNFGETYGNAVVLMNVGLYGLYILLYYNIIGAQFNGVTFGIIFCMLATCNAGSHPGNVWPIMLGYAAAVQLCRFLSMAAGGDFTQELNSQAIVVGLCYANGLTPVSDKYGWRYGMVAAMLHYFMVTTVPQLHGGLCLYNGGFTAALVCLLMIPGLERLFLPKLERRALRKK